jgi:opacity protein-like surface antigen
MVVMMVRQTVYAVALLGLSIAINAHSEGLRVEGAVGQCQAKTSGEGDWWQGDDFTSDQIKSGCYQIGVSKIYGHLGWRAAWVDLGRAKLHEDAWGGVFPDGTPGPEPHWTAKGEGRVYGPTFGGLYERSLIGKLLGSAEAGVFGYRSYWQADCEHFASGKTAPNVSTEAVWRATWYAGVGLSYPLTDRVSVTANLRYYPDVKINTVGANGDVIGPPKASYTSLIAGLQVTL